MLSSLDYDTTLENIARLSVPTLAENCVVKVMTGDDGQYQNRVIELTTSDVTRLVARLKSAASSMHDLGVMHDEPDEHELPDGSTVYRVRVMLREKLNIGLRAKAKAEA